MARRVEAGIREAVRLLEANATPWGIRASAPSPRAAARNYTSIFARDTAISVFGMVASQERSLIETAHRGLVTLGRFQAPNGQIPNFVNPETRERDFYYVGCIDATLWWLLAVAYIDTRLTARRGLRRSLSRPIRRALTWLRAQEHQEFFLLQQNEASDWADLMPRSGFVLSTNALWFTVKRLYDLPHTTKTRRSFQRLFSPAADRRTHHTTPSVRLQRIAAYGHRRRSPTFLSFVNFAFWGPELDVFGNVLACLTGLVGQPQSRRVSDALTRSRVNVPYPVKSVIGPIRPTSPLWRPYMYRHGLNTPHQYQNGGIWPFIGGFWILLLRNIGRHQEARRNLARLAAANALHGWEFNEWLHGRTGRPMGMPRQSWNAAMLLLATTAARDDGRVGRPFG